MSLKGRVALVTGASRGIGRAIALMSAIAATGAAILCDAWHVILSLYQQKNRLTVSAISAMFGAVFP